MPDYSLVPVDHQPDFPDVSLVPVDHDPFGDDGVIQQAQSASQAQQAPLYNNSEGDAAAMSPETYVNPVGQRILGDLATLPQRAIDAGAADVEHLGEGDYTPQSIGPAVDTALTAMGGSGARPATATIAGAKGAAFSIDDEGGSGLARAVPIKDLRLLHPPETIGNRPDLARLSDEELLESVINPKELDPVTVDADSGKVVDGNSRVFELQIGEQIQRAQ